MSKPQRHYMIITESASRSEGVVDRLEKAIMELEVIYTITLVGGICVVQDVIGDGAWHAFQAVYVTRKASD